MSSQTAMTRELPPKIDNETFVKRQGGECPCCGSGDLTGHGLQSEGCEAWAKISCNQCQARWNELYHLTGFEMLENGQAKAEAA